MKQLILCPNPPIPFGLIFPNEFLFSFKLPIYPGFYVPEHHRRTGRCWKVRDPSAGFLRCRGEGFSCVLAPLTVLDGTTDSKLRAWNDQVQRPVPVS